MKPSRKTQLRNLRKWTIVLMVLIAPPALYVSSIMWRVSTAEQKFFGRSDLLPLSFNVPCYTEKPIPESYGSGTFTFDRNGTKVQVYRQLVNSFQHTYGSALTALELGTSTSDFVFRANEYFEAYCLKDGRSEWHFLDTKKDLANNAVGRKIGLEARQLGLHGWTARKFIVNRTLESIDSGAVIKHYEDPRVRQLPTLEEYGCPGLPNPESTNPGRSNT